MLTRTEFEEAVKNMAEDGEVSQVVLAHDAAQRAEIERLTKASRTRADYNLRCDECGSPHWLDTSIPSDIWNRIAPDGGTLCVLCIDERLTQHGLKAEAEFYYVGKNLRSKSYGDDQITQLQAELLAWKHSAENADCLKDDIDRLTAELATATATIQRLEAALWNAAMDEAGRLLTAQAIDRARGR